MPSPTASRPRSSHSGGDRGGSRPEGGRPRRWGPPRRKVCRFCVDRVVEIERKQRIVAIKNVTFNEPHFQGHFPDYPIMPGVLMVEAIAQAGGALLLTEIPDRANKLMVFTGIDSAKFRKPVVPGDQVRIEVKVLNWRSTAVRMQGTATVEGKVVCEATVMCALVPRAAKKPDAAAQKAEG